jgi:predicted 2-oxoglutarate/Fe(II)-dependent dioxygenase YbiX
MSQQALDTIIVALKQLQTEGSFSARVVADFDDLSLEIKDIGQLKLPIKPARAKALIKKARPAKYGLKDKTLLDPQVRDVWEIPKSHIKMDKRRWNKTLNPVLLELKKELGLQDNQQLKAQLHNFLIYEKGQFFQSHQDTEKKEDMVATLVILLPSSYRGGTLLVENQGDSQRYPSTSAPKNKLTFIAFYADCQHEVKPVTDGYRIALTYNLILKPSENNIALPVVGETQQSLDKAVIDFLKQPRDATRETNSYRTSRCRKLIYLLDHEYTANGLKWDNLKAGDQIRAQALLQTAKQNDLEAFLTLADIHEIWDCESSYEGSYSRYRNWYDEDEDEDDDDGNDSDNEDSVQLLDLIDDETEIRYWLDESGKKIQYPSMSVWSDSICWTKANNECDPFEKEYEGYMGNWGDTMDYWYHRAAIVLWQRVDHYNALLEFNPAKVIEELLSQAKVLKKDQLIEFVRNLLKDWSGLNREAKATDYNRVLKLSAKINDADLADALLEKLDYNAFTISSVSHLITLEKSYGTTWCINVLKKWHTDRSYQKDAVTIDNLDKLIERLSSARGGESTLDALIEWMLTHQWQVLQTQNEIKLKYSQAAQLFEQADEQLKEVKVLIRATLIGRNQAIHDELIKYILAHNTLYPSPELVTVLLSFKRDYQQQDTSHWLHQEALQQLYKRLSAQIQKGPRKSGDWSIMDSNQCSCNDCQELNSFLQAKSTQEKIWPLNKNRRMHIHRTIDKMRLPVTHQTQRTGRPHKLVLKKTSELFSRDKKQFKKLTGAVKQLSDSGMIE